MKPGVGLTRRGGKEGDEVRYWPIDGGKVIGMPRDTWLSRVRAIWAKKSARRVRFLGINIARMRRK